MYKPVLCKGDLVYGYHDSCLEHTITYEVVSVYRNLVKLRKMKERIQHPTIRTATYKRTKHVQQVDKRVLFGHLMVGTVEVIKQAD